MSTHLPSMLIIGNCIVDQIWKIDQFPPEDAEFRALARTQQLGGNACNSAQILSKLGHSVELVAQLADDAEADWIQQQLSRLGIQYQYCAQSAHSQTPLSSIWLNEANGSRTICHYRDLPELSLAQLQQIDPDNYQWLHLEGRNIQVLQQYLPMLEKRSQFLISLEIEKPRAGIQALLPYVDVAIVSSAYLSQMQISAERCLDEFHQLNPQLQLVCTLGDRGLLALDANQQMIRMNAEAVERVVNTSGAGDCFIAGLISQMSQQIPFAEALSFASRLAASKVQQQDMSFRPEDIYD